MATGKDISSFTSAVPFFLSFLLLPIAWWAAWKGGVWVISLPVFTIYLLGALDYVGGRNLEDEDTETPVEKLFWYRLLTVLWAPLQFCLIFGTLFYIRGAEHLGRVEEWLLFIGLGVPAGAIGIVYAHELMHQKPRWERWLGDILMSMVLYGHFRSEHLLVHHWYVGTPRDAVSARYGEGFHRFFFRVLPEGLISAFRAERAMLARKDLPWWHRTNPHWRYWALEAGFVALAFALGGLWGVFLFATTALTAVWLLELTNYIEHYGLTRRHLGDGKYEPTRPHHSWNSAQRVSNWLLINLQRHSDHHVRPDRRFPLLQNHAEDAAPQLPTGYLLMGVVALVPRWWKRLMNPKVRAWRRQFYPDIEDWTPYNNGTNPMPRGAS